MAFPRFLHLHVRWVRARAAVIGSFLGSRRERILGRARCAQVIDYCICILRPDWVEVGMSFGKAGGVFY